MNDDTKVTAVDLREAAAKFLLEQFNGNGDTDTTRPAQTVALIQVALHLVAQL